MPAVNPQGLETYWFEGQPFGGLLSQNNNNAAETFWFEGSPLTFIYPITSNTGILWAFLVDF